MPARYVKDGINDCVVQGDQAAVNPEKQGTKVAAHYRLTVAAGQSATVRLRLTARGSAGKAQPPKALPYPSGRSSTRPSRHGCRRRTSSIAR